MSSRSKEKVTNAIRKLFKGNTNDKIDAVEANAVKNANIVGPTESPGKRLRRQDNKYVSL